MRSIEGRTLRKLNLDEREKMNECFCGGKRLRENYNFTKPLKFGKKTLSISGSLNFLAKYWQNK